MGEELLREAYKLRTLENRYLCRPKRKKDIGCRKFYILFA
jgi:hypothetical protein